MKKFIILLISLISILSLNTVCVNAKEPDKATSKIYFNGFTRDMNAYKIDGKNYYRIRDVLLHINDYLTDKINLRWNDKKNQIEAFFDDDFEDIYTPEALGKDPSFRVYSYKNPSNGQTVWATEDTETGEKNAYVIQDPYVYMRDRIFKPTEYSVNMLSIDGKEITRKRYDINGEYYYNIEDLCELAGCEIRYSENNDIIYVITGLRDYLSIHPETSDWSLESNDYTSLNAWEHSNNRYIYMIMVMIPFLHWI